MANDITPPDVDSGHTGKERRRGYDNFPKMIEDIARTKKSTEVTEITVEGHTKAIDSLVRSSIKQEASIDRVGEVTVDIKGILLGHIKEQKGNHEGIKDRLGIVEKRQSRAKWYKAGFVGAIVALWALVKTGLVKIMF